MRYSTNIKPISYVKANASEILRDLSERREPLIITQNGEAKAVLQDVVSFEQTRETLAMLKLVAMSNEDIAAGRTTPFRTVIDDLRARIRANAKSG